MVNNDYYWQVNFCGDLVDVIIPLNGNWALNAKFEALVLNGEWIYNFGHFLA